MRNSVAPLEEWLERRKELLVAEKAATKQLEELARKRRALPWTLVPEYRFDTEDGPRELSDLFAGRSQLLVYHFMLGPGWAEGCKSCSFLSDHFDGPNKHLPHHDVTLIAVSRAPLNEIAAYKARMGWRFPWVSSNGSDFNDDFGVSFSEPRSPTGPPTYNYAPAPEWVGEEMPGTSVFAKDDRGIVYHTYSTYARGLDLLIGAHNLLDLTPKGRNEQSTMDWVRRHDRYVVSGPGDACCSSKTP